MRPLARVHELLAGRGILHALIGAAAVSVHGHLRSTADFDLLATDGAVLRDETWKPLVDEGWIVEILRGEFSDPLAGTAFLQPPGDEMPIDVVVGKWRWQREALERAGRTKLSGVELPVVGAADLVLLKLDAGSPTDLDDVRRVLAAAVDESRVRTIVEETIGRLGAEARASWSAMVAERERIPRKSAD